VNIWSYDLDLEQVTVKPQAEALANTPALLLGGAEDALEQFEFGGTTIETVTTWVRLEPKNKDSGFNRVELGFIDGELRRMAFFDNLEQTTLVALHDVTVNEPIESARFEFVVPDGVDLVGTPAATVTAVP
jgi:outer membrane lipoprotein carrier protein